VDGN